MGAPYARLAAQFRFNETLLDMVSNGFGPDEWATRLGDANSPHWIVGHLAHSRRYLARRLGADLPEEPWEALFTAGVDAGALEPAGFPPADELAAGFRAVGDELSRHLEALTEEEASAEWTKFPNGDSSLGGGIHFMFMHECYHTGQIGLVRRAVGRPGFV